MPQETMTAGALTTLFAECEVQDDWEIWLSSDAEGNEILPMPAEPRWSLAMDADGKTVTLFPSHR